MRPSTPTPDQAEFRKAFLAAERQVRINTGKLACALVVVLMPFGTLLDYFVYPEHLARFLELRLLCSALVAVVWVLHSTPLAETHYPLLGMPIVILPVSFMTWMIYQTEGPASPYYAGLNLVLLAVSAVGHWSLLESFVAVGTVISIYVIANLAKGYDQSHLGLFFSNLYFLFLTGIIVVTGNYLFNRLRIREFTLRFELDQNRRKLEESHRKLLELDQAKSHFFANVSHELRTPLTLLLAPLESLLHQRRVADRETFNLLATMHANGMRLLKLINDLLDLVRLESGRLEVKREPLNLIDFLNGLASAARQVADDKGLQLEVAIEPGLVAALADRDKLEKIVLNLLFNALKFTPTGGRVKLSGARQGGSLILQVADTGVGIAREHLPHVFDRFWQSDTSSTRRYQGAGIGLALVKELTEAQGGDVTVQTEKGQGTTFTVRLPYTPAPTAPAAPAAAPPTDSGSSEEWLTNLYHRAELFAAMTVDEQDRKRIEPARSNDRPVVLVAEDELNMLRFLRSQLAQDYHVLEAVDGRQAVEQALQHTPDLILLDMMMPEKDGLQACKEIRQQVTTRNIPVVLLTARADEETKLASLSAGASDFLAKPFSTAELQIRVRNLIESHRLQKQLARQNQLLASTIEQLKETEVQLVQAEKLASLGRLSAGIIHEINNPLNFAATGLYSLRGKERYLQQEQRPEFVEILSDVEEGIQRVKKIVTDLRSFTHPGTGQLEEVKVGEAVDTARRLLSHECKEDVQIHQQIPDRLVVEANRSKLVQVFVNLLQNSLDALKRKSFNGERPTIWIEGRLDEGRNVISVRDNGSGIESDIVDKIFDPFFTTKDVGKGMGLGLSITYRIVEEFGGRLTVKTEVGKFTEFTLTFPRKS